MRVAGDGASSATTRGGSLGVVSLDRLSLSWMLPTVAALLMSGCPTKTQWLMVADDAGGGTLDSGVHGDAGPPCGGDELCDGLCRDTRVDPTSCGGCNLRCDAEERCVDGVCVCRHGLSRCGGECVDTDADPTSCGGCQVDCTGTSTPYCYQGVCSAVSCADQVPAAEACGSEEHSCVDDARLQTSALHCGECDNACEVDSLCVYGECRSYFPAVGCTACPCDQVCGASLCCLLSGASVPVCLVGATRCP